MPKNISSLRPLFNFNKLDLLQFNSNIFSDQKQNDKRTTYKINFVERTFLFNSLLYISRHEKTFSLLILSPFPLYITSHLYHKCERNSLYATMLAIRKKNENIAKRTKEKIKSKLLEDFFSLLFLQFEFSFRICFFPYLLISVILKNVNGRKEIRRKK